MFEIFEFGFMKRAFAAGIIIALTAPMIGIFLVVRRYSLMADTLAHVSLVGVALGLLTKTSPIVNATIVAVLTGVGIEKLRKSKKIFGESAVALFLWAGLAVAIVMLSIAKGFNVDLFSFLFGSIATVSVTDIYFISVLAVFVFSLIIMLYKELFAVSFDEELAKASGLDTDRYNLVIVVLAALTISLSMRIVGILLIGALMIIPVLTSMQLNRSFKQTLVFSILFSLFSVISGLFLSYYFDLASGGTIVLVAILLFVAVFFIKSNNNS